MRILKNLVGEFVSAQVVKAATQKEYNQREWNNTVDRYSKYDECRFFKTPGTIYEFDYYVVYVADGIRFLGQVSYGSCLSSGGFVYGFFTKGMEDKEAALELISKYPELKYMEQDSLTILGFKKGRLDTSEKTRSFMREQTADLGTRFFTKLF